MRKSIFTLFLTFIFIPVIVYGQTTINPVSFSLVPITQVKSPFVTTDESVSLFPSSFGSTFVKQYDVNQSSLNADESSGFPLATFTASRSSTTPATFISGNGLVEIITDDDIARFTKGFYDSSGFTSAPGLLLEGASTNLIKQGIFADDGNSDGVADNWAKAGNIVGSSTESLAEEDFTNISNSKAQRFVYTGEAGDTFKSYILRSDRTGAATVSQNDLVTISWWMKGSVDDANQFLLVMSQYNNSDSFISDLTQSFLGQVSATDWQRFSHTFTANQATVDRVLIAFQIGGVVDGTEIDMNYAGVQVEVATFPSSVTPTTTAALTTNEEIEEYVIASNRTAATESCVIKFRPNFASGVSGGDQYLMDTDTKSRNIRYTSGSNDFEIFANETDTVGSTVADLVNESWNANESITLGYSMQSTGNPNIAGYFNGVADGTDSNTDFTAPAWGTDWQIGADNSTGNNFFGIIEAVACFDKFLSASEHSQVFTILNR